jgi:hypothetical protein
VAHVSVEPAATARSEVKSEATIVVEVRYSLIAVILVGCGKKDDGIAKHQKMKVQVTLSPQVLALGLTNTIAESLGIDSSNGISVYLVAWQNVSNTLVARAVNANGVEIGRASNMVVMRMKSAHYVIFNFDRHMDASIVKQYEIGF